jgi:hypothetical protein
LRFLERRARNPIEGSVVEMVPVLEERAIAPVLARELVWHEVQRLRVRKGIDYCVRGYPRAREEDAQMLVFFTRWACRHRSTLGPAVACRTAFPLASSCNRPGRAGPCNEVVK